MKDMGRGFLLVALALFCFWLACVPLVKTQGVTASTVARPTPVGESGFGDAEPLGADAQVACPHVGSPGLCMPLAELWREQRGYVGRRVRVTGRLTRSLRGAGLSVYPSPWGDIRVLLRGPVQCADGGGEVAIDAIVALPTATLESAMIADGWAIELHEADIVGTAWEQCRD